MANPQTWGGNYTGYRLHFDVSRSSNPGANQSTFTWSAYIYATAVNFKPFNLNNTSTAVGYIGGSLVLNQTFSYDFRSAVANTVVKNFGSGTLTVNHDSAGNLPTQYAYATVVLQGNPGSATADSYVAGADYDRSPSWASISTPSPAIRGSGYSGNFTANAAGSYGIIGGTFPPGLSFNTGNGNISGTPTTDGSDNFTVRAYGLYEGAIDANRTIVVNPPLPVFTDSTIAGIAIRGVPYSDGVSATETSSYSIAASSLPTGLSFNTSTGAITGTATETFQTRNPVFRASNVTGSTDTPARSIVVNPPAPVFSDSTVLGSASIGSPYSDQVVASDVASYSVFSGTLPDGLTLNTSTGVISGTPTTAGDSTFVIRATNVTGSTNTPSRTITVISPVRVWTGSDFSVGQLNVWNGSDFTIGVMKVWDGTTWVSAK
jgi:hypothetical protein